VDPRALIAAALAAFAVACSGPHATATDTRVRPSSRAGFYRVETRLENAGGSGQVDVIVHLRNRETGRTVTQQQPVDLQRHDHADVAVEIPAPPGNYDVDVTVQYPPQ
jgi:hypothetical protein